MDKVIGTPCIIFRKKKWKKKEKCKCKNGYT